MVLGGQLPGLATAPLSLGALLAIVVVPAVIPHRQLPGAVLTPMSVPTPAAVVVQTPPPPAPHYQLPGAHKLLRVS